MLIFSNLIKCQDLTAVFVCRVGFFKSIYLGLFVCSEMSSGVTIK